MITKELQESLLAAMSYARKRRHEYLCLEHVLYSFTEEPSSSKILKACAVDLSKLRRQLEEFFDQKVTPLPEGADQEPEQTVSIQRVLQRAIFHMHSSGKSQISSGDVLAAMFREQDSHAIFLLESQGVTRLDVINYLSHGIEKSGSSDGEDGETGDLSVSKSEPGSDGDSEDEEGGESDKKKSLLERYTVNLVAEAKAGRIDPLIGRESELTRTMQVLCRRRKTTRSTSVTLVLARPLWRKVWPGRSHAARCPRSCRSRWCTRSISAVSSLAPSSEASSSSA